MFYNTTASLDKLTCTVYVVFGKCQDRFGQLFRSENDYLDVKVEMFLKNDNSDFLLVENITMWEAVFSQFMWLMKQQVIAAEIYGRDENLSPVLIPTRSKDKINNWTETGSQCGWRGGPRKQRDLCDFAAVQYGQVRISDALVWIFAWR